MSSTGPWVEFLLDLWYIYLPRRYRNPEVEVHPDIHPEVHPPLHPTSNPEGRLGEPEVKVLLDTTRDYPPQR